MANVKIQIHSLKAFLIKFRVFRSLITKTYTLFLKIEESRGDRILLTWTCDLSLVCRSIIFNFFTFVYQTNNNYRSSIRVWKLFFLKWSPYFTYTWKQDEKLCYHFARFDCMHKNIFYNITCILVQIG